MARVVMALAVLLAVAAPAHADIAEAKKHYERGTRAYNLLDFKGALKEFQTAYVEQPDPIFLFNIAQCHRQLGSYSDAAKSYRLFLANQPDAPNRAQVQRLIEEMDTAAKEARANLPPPGPQAPAPAAAQPAPVAAVEAAPPPRRKWYASPLGWGLIGGGVAVVGVSGGLLGVAMSERDKALSATTQPTFDDHHNRSITFQQAGWPLLAVGGACVVSGAVVLALNARKVHQ